MAKGVPKRAHRAGFQESARAPNRHDSVGAMHRQTCEHGHAGVVQEISDRERLHERATGGAGERDQVDRILPQQDQEHSRRHIDDREEVWRKSSRFDGATARIAGGWSKNSKCSFGKRVWEK